MSVIPFIKGTPVWVWILLLFLVKRGVNTLSDREMNPARLFFLPVLFLAWGILGVLQETMHPSAALLLMLPGLLVGFAAGWWLWRRQPRLRNVENSKLIVRAGTPLTLMLILFTFTVKFILTSAFYLQPELRGSMAASIIFGLLSGILDGVFWGGTLNLFIPWYNENRRFA